MIPGCLDEMWEELRRVAGERELLPSSPSEWADAWNFWKRFDAAQKLKAIEYLKSNEGMEVTHATVTSFMRKQIFLRPAPRSGKRQPVRAAPPPQAPPQCPRCRDFGYLPRGNWRIPPNGATAAEIRVNCVACECGAGAEQARIWREE